MTICRTGIAVLVFGVLGAGSALADAELHGFAEYGVGVRTTSNSAIPGDYTLQEARGQLQLGHYGDTGELFMRVDFVHDVVAEGDADATDVELREAFARTTLFGQLLDVKAGRQALTWGTGDLVFVNDLFPKDWVSFFAGRDDAYLKAPADAVRIGFFGLPIDTEVVWMPTFTPDRTPTGERFSFFQPAIANRPPDVPDPSLENGAIALRASGYAGTAGWALYGYHGFRSTPDALRVDGSDADLTATPIHARLSSLGASIRGAVGGGLGTVEMGYAHSPDDTRGRDPLIPNSAARGFVGLERQIATDFTVGAQAYAEWMVDHDRYVASLPSGLRAADQWRQLYTLRIEKLLLYQTLRLSLFAFGSPTDEDVYLRPLVRYKASDEVDVSVGANLFAGKHVSTQFGQFDKNDNVWARLRYQF